MRDKSNETDSLTYIKNCLAAGETREAVSQRLGYRNWRSLDMFMRRKGMKWDSRRNIYYSADDEEYLEGNEYSRVHKIISMFNHKDADPKNIAEQAGFSDHHKMAAYMLANDYVWSHDINNYILNTARTEQFEDEINESHEEEGSPETQEYTDVATDISKYLPLLELLSKNSEKLKTMFTETALTIPRYTVSGIVRTKSFYMSDRVSRLINDYSRSKNISQKEIIEAAIIEFMCKYSYKDEVHKILDPKFVP